MTDTGWTQAKRLGPQINYGIFLQQSPSVSPDGQKLYYVDSERGSVGTNWDIWVSTWDSSISDWGTPQNLGWPVNTPGVEYSAKIGPDGRHLYFSSESDSVDSLNPTGRCGLYVSTWDVNNWSIPVALGAGYCGISEYPSITADSKELYYRQVVGDGTSSFVNCWKGSGWGDQVDLRSQLGGRTGEPYITPSGDSLFFAGCSDFPGYGGCDIWMARRLLPGDLNMDYQLTASDAVLELNKVFLDEPFPAPAAAGDLNCDNLFTPADAVLELRIVFGINAKVTGP